MGYLYQDKLRRHFVSVDGRSTTLGELQEEQRVREREQNPEKAADQEAKEQARRASIAYQTQYSSLKALGEAGTPISVVPAPPGIEWVGLDGDDLHEVRQPVQFVVYIQLSPYHFDTRLRRPRSLHLSPFYSIHWGQWTTHGLGEAPRLFFHEFAHCNSSGRGACSCKEKTCEIVGLAFPGAPFPEETLEKRREWLRKLEVIKEKARERYQRSKQKKAAEEV